MIQFNGLVVQKHPHKSVPTVMVTNDRRWCGDDEMVDGSFKVIARSPTIQKLTADLPSLSFKTLNAFKAQLRQVVDNEADQWMPPAQPFQFRYSLKKFMLEALDKSALWLTETPVSWPDNAHSPDNTNLAKTEESRSIYAFFDPSIYK